MKKNIKKINRNSHKNLVQNNWMPGIRHTEGAFVGICLDYSNDIYEEMTDLDF